MATTDWVDFFSNAGLPSRFAQKYAVLFEEHRIRTDMLKDLSKEILADMGIKTMGDVIAILRHAKEVAEEDNKVKVLGQKSASKPAAAAPASRQVATTRSSPAASGISTQLAKRLGPTDSGIAAKRRIVESNVEFGSVGRAARKVTPPSDAVHERHVVQVSLPTASRAGITQRINQTLNPQATVNNTNRPIFSRLGSTGNGTSEPARIVRLGGSGLTKATATVKPTTVVKTAITAPGAVSTVKDRLGNFGSYSANGSSAVSSGFKRKLSGPREVTAGNIRFKSDPIATEAKPKPRMVALKKSIFDRLGE